VTAAGAYYAAIPQCCSAVFNSPESAVVTVETSRQLPGVGNEGSELVLFSEVPFTEQG